MAEEAEGLSPEVLELKDKGNKLFASGELDKAVKAYSDGLKLAKDSHVLFSNRAAAYTKLGNLEMALKDAGRCIELQPEWAKGYTRLAQALYRKGDYEECKKQLCKLEQLEPENRSIKLIRDAIKTKEVFKKLEGKWHGKVSPELGGYVQSFNFISETEVLVSVFGRELMSRLRLDVSHDPAWLDLLVQQEPGAPPAPEVKHIFRLEGDTLHLCSPYQTPPEVRPTSFEGPAYVKMIRGEGAEDESAKQAREKVQGMSEEERCRSFAEEIIAIVPKTNLGPGLESTDPVEAQKAMLVSVKFQNSYFELKNIYGDAVEELLQAYLMKERPAPPSLAPTVERLRTTMQKAGMYPEEPEGTPNIDSLNVTADLVPEKPAAPAKAEPQAEPAQATPAARAATKTTTTTTTTANGAGKTEDKVVGDPTALYVALGVAAVAASLVGVYFLRRQK